MIRFGQEKKIANTFLKTVSAYANYETEVIKFRITKDELLVLEQFETEEVFECVLVTHKNDKNPLTKELVDLLQLIYREKEKHYPL